MVIHPYQQVSWSSWAQAVLHHPTGWMDGQDGNDEQRGIGTDFESQFLCEGWYQAPAGTMAVGLMMMMMMMGNIPRLRHPRARSRQRPSFHEVHCSDFPGSVLGHPGSLIVHSQCKVQTSSYMFVAQNQQRDACMHRLVEYPKVSERKTNKQEKQENKENKENKNEVRCSRIIRLAYDDSWRLR